MGKRMDPSGSAGHCGKHGMIVRTVFQILIAFKLYGSYRIFPLSYSPVFCSKENESFVIEMGDSRTTMGHVEKLQREYALNQIPNKWLVVGEETLFLRENGVSFLKRFLLNESKNNDFIFTIG